ncbi:MAG TPA: TIGR03618 family F420-dependent PPOX class oxidoreductase [Gaiellaceae bacterium]|nr:TIGR03618 family F420-dependent PPOX class oxidoreductase [Gaiellaceae bacterium]
MPVAPLPPELERFVAAPRRAVVGTVRDDGTPVTTACWYGVDDDGRLVLSMSHDSHRLRHIRANPRVALTILGEDWYHHVSIVGRAVDLRSDDDLADIDALSQRYGGVDYDDRDYLGVTVFVEIERWHTWGDPASEA